MTGVYCFDTWIKYSRKQGCKISMQYHDEQMQNILKTQQEEIKQKLLTAIKLTNDELKLNIELGISVDFGRSYADIH